MTADHVKTAFYLSIEVSKDFIKIYIMEAPPTTTAARKYHPTARTTKYQPIHISSSNFSQLETSSENACGEIEENGLINKPLTKKKTILYETGTLSQDRQKL